MTEQLISFETAVLAKEKGFDWNTSIKFQPKLSFSSWKDFKWSMSAPRILRPTQSLLQKWLREKHDIHVEVNAEGLMSFKVSTFIMGDKSKEIVYPNYYNPETLNTYEEALEKGLQEALKLI
jgi:hypothetical protein